MESQNVSQNKFRKCVLKQTEVLVLLKKEIIIIIIGKLELVSVLHLRKIFNLIFE